MQTAGMVEPQTSRPKSRVFISYSRKDVPFVDLLASALTDRGYFVDFDLGGDAEKIDGGIAPTDAWQARLKAMITAADVVVFVVSPSSAASSVCDWEIGEAQSLSKRLIPILWRRIDFASAPRRLAALNVAISFVRADEAAALSESEFATPLDWLVRTIETDIDWLREGKRLTALAVRWRESGAAETQLLRLGEVSKAEAWAARRPLNAPPPARLLLEFLAKGREKEERDRLQLRRTSGRAFVKPAEQALKDGLPDKALVYVLASAMLAEDPDFAIVPELLGPALSAAGLARLERRLAGGGRITDSSFSRDGRRLVTGSSDAHAIVWDTASGREIRRFEGHVASVNCAEFSEDGDRIATASEDGTVRVWDAASGRPLHVLGRQATPVRAVSFNRQGDRILGIGEDHTPLLWDATTGLLVALLAGHTGQVRSGMFSPDGRQLVTASDDTTIRTWDARSGNCLGVLRGHKFFVTQAVFSPDGKRVASASGRLFPRRGLARLLDDPDNTARIWDVARGALLIVLKGHTKLVRSLAISPDGERIATASYDTTARIWSTENGRCLAVLAPHADAVESVVFSPDGQRVATASADGAVRLWHATSGAMLAELRGHAGKVRKAVFSSDGSHLLSVSNDTAARLWDARVREISLKHDEAIVSAQFSADGSTVITASGAVLASRDNRAVVWETASGTALAVLAGHRSGLTAASLNADASRAVTASWDRSARLWDARSGSCLAVLEGHRSAVTTAGFSPDGSLILTASADGTARLWTAATGKPALLPPLRHGATVKGALFDSAMRWLVTIANDGTARIWNAASGREERLLQRHGGEVTAAAFAPDGNKLVTVSADKTGMVWDVASGSEIARLVGHTGALAWASFSPKGTAIVTASHDGTARVWCAETGNEMIQLLGHEGAVARASFCSRGKRVVTASADKTARVWDARTGVELARLAGHQAALVGACFSPDGARVLTASTDTTARIWAEPGLSTFAKRPRLAALLDRLAGGAGQLLPPDRDDLLLRDLPEDLVKEARQRFPELTPPATDGSGVQR